MNWFIARFNESDFRRRTRWVDYCSELIISNGKIAKSRYSAIGTEVEDPVMEVTKDEFIIRIKKKCQKQKKH